jgi:hypothetical protein
MAIVTWPLSSGEARGRVGGLVYNTWRGRSYVKQHVHNQSGLSDPQKIIQGYARDATAAWNTITQAKRDAWDQFALDHAPRDWTGQHKRLSGYNWFLRSSVTCQLLTLTGPDVPPTQLLSYIPTDFRIVDISPYYIELSWTRQPAPDPPYIYIDFWLEGPHSASRKPNITRAHRFDFCPDLYQDMVIDIPTPGYWTVHYRAIPDYGLPMHFHHITGLCA